jgi:hypothetical protein
VLGSKLLTINQARVEPGPICWSPEERHLARQAVDLAYEREVSSLIMALHNKVSEVHCSGDVWSLHDYLSAKRHEMDGKFDLRDSSLLFVFATLLKDGLLSVGELDGLDRDKLVKITALARM